MVRANIFELRDSTIVISFPSNSQQSEIKGDIYFYRPSDSKRDFKIDIHANSEFRQIIDLDGIESGLWRIKILWEMDGLNYLSTTNFLQQ
jgi:hypothetical protein